MASGGYYINTSDKILANRNCWTGSIGVTISTIFDISEFLKMVLKPTRLLGEETKLWEALWSL